MEMWINCSLKYLKCQRKDVDGLEFLLHFRSFSHDAFSWLGWTASAKAEKNAGRMEQKWDEKNYFSTFSSNENDAFVASISKTHLDHQTSFTLSTSSSSCAFSLLRLRLRAGITTSTRHVRHCNVTGNYFSRFANWLRMNVFIRNLHSENMKMENFPNRKTNEKRRKLSETFPSILDRSSSLIR